MMYLLPGNQRHKHVFSDAWFKVPEGRNLIIPLPQSAAILIFTLNVPEESAPDWTVIGRSGRSASITGYVSGSRFRAEAAVWPLRRSDATS